MTATHNSVRSDPAPSASAASHTGSGVPVATTIVLFTIVIGLLVFIALV